MVQELESLFVHLQEILQKSVFVEGRARADPCITMDELNIFLKQWHLYAHHVLRGLEEIAGHMESQTSVIEE
jgi:hypothetical protein